jgi:hypothetical protein
MTVDQLQNPTNDNNSDVRGPLIDAVISAAFAAKRPTIHGIDPTAALKGDGHSVRVSGRIGCTAGETLQLRVTVTQDSSGVVA